MSQLSYPVLRQFESIFRCGRRCRRHLRCLRAVGRGWRQARLSAWVPLLWRHTRGREMIKKSRYLSLLTVGNRTGMGSPHLEWIQPRVQACEVAFNHEFRIKHKQIFCQSEIRLCLFPPLICYLLVLNCVFGFDCILKRCFLTTGTFSQGTTYMSEKGGKFTGTNMKKKMYEAPF